MDWTFKTHNLNSGSNSIKFAYGKDGSVDSGSDIGWVDLVKVRKYTSPEPTVTIGSQESLSEESAWVNDTWVSMTGTGNWSNVTKVVNSTIGATIAWKVYANDSVNLWNASQTYSFTTTYNPYISSCSI